MKFWISDNLTLNSLIFLVLYALSTTQKNIAKNLMLKLMKEFFWDTPWCQKLFRVLNEKSKKIEERYYVLSMKICQEFSTKRESYYVSIFKHSNMSSYDSLRRFFWIFLMTQKRKFLPTRKLKITKKINCWNQFMMQLKTLKFIKKIRIKLLRARILKILFHFYMKKLLLQFLISIVIYIMMIMSRGIILIIMIISMGRIQCMMTLMCNRNLEK